MKTVLLLFYFVSFVVFYVFIIEWFYSNTDGKHTTFREYLYSIWNFLKNLEL